MGVSNVGITVRNVRVYRYVNCVRRSLFCMKISVFRNVL